MNAKLKDVFRREMTSARAMYSDGDLDRAFHHLERAHILGQRYILPHTLTHWWMLKIGLRRFDGREITGQVLRILGSLLLSRFWVPLGNTGGANVSPVKPMPIPEDLSRLIGPTGENKSKYRLLLLMTVILGGLVLAGLLFLKQHNRELVETEREWRETRHPKIETFGSVNTLSILPLVNWHVSPGTRLKGEAGVAYLIKTEKYRILFDLGHNAGNESPSPLRHNMKQLGIAPDDIDAIFISHAHFDHLGGRRWSRAGTFSMGTVQDDLAGKKIFTPVPMTYPGARPIHTPAPRKLLEGIAGTGTIPRRLFMGRIDEQALVINVRGKGLVVIVGCGHQTQRKIIERIESVFAEKIHGMVGDLHYPLPTGRIKILGLNAQRLFASGSGPFRPMQWKDVETDIQRLKKRAPGIVALGGHDSSDRVIARFAQVFGRNYRHVRVGEWIHVQ